MEQAKINNMLVPEQFGSRKNHRSNMVALNHRLTFDLCRQRRQALAIVSVDAKSCYDRIVHNTASISLQRIGIPLQPLLSMFKTLQMAHHHVMTAFGVSEETYSSLLEIPLQGIGQGNGAGPAIWAVVNAPIIDMVKQSGGGAIFRTAIALSCLQFAGFSFVDDVDIVQTDNHVDTSGELLIPRIQKSLDIQNGGLFSSGGALKKEKCIWRLIDWEESPLSWKLRNKQDMPGELSILNYDTKEREQISRIETDEAREVLGVHIAPTGNWGVQQTKIAKTLADFCKRLKHAYLSKDEVKCAIDVILWKKLEYLYPAAGLTRQEWDESLRPVIGQIMNAFGTNRNFPRRLIFGPEKYQGLGISHPFDAQMISQIITLVEEGNRSSISGETIKATTEQFILEIGTAKGINTSDERLHQWITPSWITDIWKYATDNHIFIEQPHQLQQLRTHDVFLMDVFRSLPFSNEQLYLLNETRIALQVITITDISDANGTHILPTFLEAEEICDRRTHEWPRKRSMTPDMRKLWKKALTLGFLMSETTLLLRQPLGNWLRQPKWHEWWNETENRLYIFEDNVWQIWIPSPRRTRNQKYMPIEDTVTQPSGIPISCANHRSLKSIFSTTRFPIESTPRSQSLQDQIKQLPADTKWTIDKWSIQGPIQILISEIISGSAMAVSDGSVKEKRGTSCFILTNEIESFQVIGLNRIPGLTEDSHRAELGGIAGVVVWLSQLCIFYQITKGSITIGLDGDSAIKSILKPLKANASDYDILWLIENIRKTLPISITFKWIKGHQTKHKKISEIDIWGRLNEMADTLAKKYWKHTQKNPILTTSE